MRQSAAAAALSIPSRAVAIANDKPPLPPLPADAVGLLPSALTCLGHSMSLLWVLGAPAWLGLLGLCCDVADGRLARALRRESDFGAAYDWLVDCTLTPLCLLRLADAFGPLILLGALLLAPLQALAQVRGTRVSGRALLMTVALVTT